jgi:GxxExxY protein
MTENEIATVLVDIFYRIHTTLGPGLFESVYEEVICYELELLEIEYDRQPEIPLIYKSLRLPAGFRADIIVEDKVIVEI